MDLAQLELIEHLDFDPDIPCDFDAWHVKDIPSATKRVNYSHECGMEGVSLLCVDCVHRFMAETDWKCKVCHGSLKFLSHIIDSITDLR